MGKSSKSIIEHIPQFLINCKRMGLSDKTCVNYKHYLNRFILWLEEKNKTALLPHELTTDDAQVYKAYLAHYTDEKGHPLKKISQNYYLIALRAILGYFTAKDIEALPAGKIALSKASQGEKTVKFLALEQVERLLTAPDARSSIGLRDRAILRVLVSTGLKVNQLRNLNRDTGEILSKEALLSVREYLKIRHDENRALFINYKGPIKSTGKRLSVRSIERIIKGYGRKIGLPFFITPEILRWARALTLANKKIEIQKSQNHQILEINNYKISSTISTVDNKKTRNLSPTWNNIENIINSEITWLRENIPVLPEVYKQNPPFFKYDDAILRKIAILIVSGNVKAAELRYIGGKDLWDGFMKRSNSGRISYHGKDWHRKMMDLISEYFKSQNYKVDSEPVLNYGRADIGVYPNPGSPLYVEVGTVSLFKLWYNLSTMKNVIFLVIPSEKNIIEFRT